MKDLIRKFSNISIAAEWNKESGAIWITDDFFSITADEEKGKAENLFTK